MPGNNKRSFGKWQFHEINDELEIQRDSNMNKIMKNIDVNIPLHKIEDITAEAGAGRPSLALGILCPERQ